MTGSVRQRAAALGISKTKMGRIDALRLLRPDLADRIEAGTLEFSQATTLAAQPPEPEPLEPIADEPFVNEPIEPLAPFEPEPFEPLAVLDEPFGPLKDEPFEEFEDTLILDDPLGPIENFADEPFDLDLAVNDALGPLEDDTAMVDPILDEPHEPTQDALEVTEPETPATHETASAAPPEATATSKCAPNARVTVNPATAPNPERPVPVSGMMRPLAIISSRPREIT